MLDYCYSDSQFFVLFFSLSVTMVTNVSKTSEKASFFLPKRQTKPSTECQVPSHELEEGLHSRLYLLLYNFGTQMFLQILKALPMDFHNQWTDLGSKEY